MDYKKYLFYIILIFLIFSICSYSNAQNKDQSYMLLIIKYKYDKETKKTIKRGRSSVVKNISEPVPIELSTNSPTKTFSSVGGVSRGLKWRLMRHIFGKKFYTGRKKIPTLNIYNRTWFIYVQPIFDENYQVKDTFFSIEYQEKVKLKSSDINNLFQIKRFTFSENELRFSKEFNYTNNNTHIDKLVPNDKRVKLLLAEDDKSILFATFEVLVGSEKEKKIKELKSLDKKSTIVLSRYDIKYQNSEGHEQVLKNIWESQQFKIKAYVQDVKNPVTSKKEKVNYILKGKIIPLKYESKIQLLIRHEKIVVDEKGNEQSKGSFDYSKTIALKTTDVVKIELSTNWPEIHFDYPYSKDQKDDYNKKIKKQSLFVKPAKMEN